MSAYDDFCGCGEYSCNECFINGDAVGLTGNAWLDEAIIERAKDRVYAPAFAARVQAKIRALTVGALDDRGARP